MKIKEIKQARWGLWVILPVLIVSLMSCASTPNAQRSRAPIEDRSRLTGQTTTSHTSSTTTQAATGSGYHVVTQGDTLYSIARTYRVSVADIVSTNQLSDANQISVGQRILIPGLGSGSRTTIVSSSNTAGGTNVTTTPLNASNLKETTVSTTVSRTPGNWAWPVEGGEVVAKFGSNGAKGIEIAAPLGSPVLAADAGKVIFSSNNIRGYGNLIVIRHNSEFLTAYGYNSQLLVKEGDAVNKGDKIATVGSSGTDSPKLHFEIRNAQSKPEDPLLYLPKR